MSERGEKAVIIIHFSEGYELASMGGVSYRTNQPERKASCTVSKVEVKKISPESLFSIKLHVLSQSSSVIFFFKMIRYRHDNLYL